MMEMAKQLDYQQIFQFLLKGYHRNSIITNPTWTALRAKPGLWGEKPATDCLNYGMVIQ
jgi:hypothetical protein